MMRAYRALLVQDTKGMPDEMKDELVKIGTLQGSMGYGLSAC